MAKHNKNFTANKVGHFRIKQNDRFVAGEFAEFKHAGNWARDHLHEFWVVVECDRYGNELGKAEFIDST